LFVIALHALPTAVPLLPSPRPAAAVPALARLAGGNGAVVIGDVRPIEEFDVVEVEGGGVEGEGVDGGGEERVDLDGVGEVGVVRGEVVGRLVLLVSFQRLQQELETALLHLAFVFLELAHALGALADFREHYLTIINNIK
jgi:hypothetical protein